MIVNRRIKIKDNCYNGQELKDVSDIDIERDIEAVNDLRFISETSIANLADKHGKNLLIFPHCLNASCKDIDGDHTIITFKGDKIVSSNYMGFVGRGAVELSITSRFDSGENNCFMHYMLQKVFAVNLFDMPFSKDDHSIWDFLIYLFPYYLKRALRQGIYKRYQKQRHNDSRVRGTIDVSRHIKYNIPFGGKIAYNTREYSFDNELTQLLRHTIEYIRSHKLGGQNIINCDSETSQAVVQIVAATPTYIRSGRSRIIAVNTKPECHPYFTEYTFLQKLCLKILRHEKVSFGSNVNESVYGLIFDGAWLWEEYLSTLLKDEGFKHPRNNDKMGRIYLFENNRGERYPDFYNDEIVLDAKYKWLSEYANRDDINQLIAYMHCLPASKGGLIYPSVNTDKSISGDYGTLKGYGGVVSRHYLNISQNINFKQFCYEMKFGEQKLMNEISCLSNSNY